MWLDNCLHKRSLATSQDLETEMCDKGGKAKERSAFVNVMRSHAFCGGKGRKNLWLDASQDCKSSMLEQEKVERRNLVTSVWLSNCLHKCSLSASRVCGNFMLESIEQL
ncbi:MAG TPA: hypothetical protein DHV12_02340 [Thermotogae bacterium]|nr:hypothetical protein [Thermotogota bacterium]